MQTSSQEQTASLTIMEAINTVCMYLRRQQTAFSFERAWQVAELHYRVAIHQVAPEQKQRVFDVAPLDVPYCWNVTEVEA